MIVLGMGWQRAALAQNALELALRSLKQAGAQGVDCIAVPAFKKGDELPWAVAHALGVGVFWVDQTRLQQMQAACQTFSATVREHVGLASVAEACALAGAGEGAHLCLPRQVFCGVTCAVAEGDRK